MEFLLCGRSTMVFLSVRQRSVFLSVRQRSVFLWDIGVYSFLWDRGVYSFMWDRGVSQSFCLCNRGVSWYSFLHDRSSMVILSVRQRSITEFVLCGRSIMVFLSVWQRSIMEFLSARQRSMTEVVLCGRCWAASHWPSWEGSSCWPSPSLSCSRSSTSACTWASCSLGPHTASSSCPSCSGKYIGK